MDLFTSYLYWYDSHDYPHPRTAHQPRDAVAIFYEVLGIRRATHQAVGLRRAWTHVPVPKIARPCLSSARESAIFGGAAKPQAVYRRQNEYSLFDRAIPSRWFNLLIVVCKRWLGTQHQDSHVDFADRVRGAYVCVCQVRRRTSV